MSARVLVTGVSGFIGSRIAASLVERGYAVRGTSRHGQSTREFETVAADLNTPGSFDAAVRDCDVVIHAASPYVLDVKDPQRDLVDPAVRGTQEVLDACARAGHVRRVVLTSSMAAITDEPPADRVLTENDWNTRSSLARNPYYFSKTLAERAAWEFMARARPQFSLVAINPFLVIGPSLVPSLNVSNQIFVDLLKGTYPGIIRISWGVVDVRDVAEAHIRAMEIPSAEGRYVCAGDVISMKDIVALLRDQGWGQGRRLPSVPLPDALVKAASYLQKPGVGQYLRTHVGHVPRFDNSKIRRDLGVTFRPARESILDTMEDLARWGHLT